MWGPERIIFLVKPKKELALDLVGYAAQSKSFWHQAVWKDGRSDP